MNTPVSQKHSVVVVAAHPDQTLALLPENRFHIQTIASPEKAREFIYRGDGINHVLLLVHDPPQMDGLEILREAGEQARDYGIVFLCAEDCGHTIRQALKLGVTDFLVRGPGLDQELVTTIESVRNFHHQRLGRNHPWRVGPPVVDTRTMKEQMVNLQIAREQKAELEKLNQDKDLLLQILTHDLRNSFNSLLGFSEILANNLSDQFNEMTSQALTAIREVSRQSHQLLEDLLNWSRSQSGRLPFRPEQLDLPRLIHDLLCQIQYTAIDKNIRITKDLSAVPFEAKFIRADREMLLAILRNLLLNAIKYSQPGSQVRIKTRMEPGNIFIHICDQGVGMTSEQLETIWQVSKQKSRRGTRNENGAGLGLLLCREFVRRHGGDIQVKSAPGEGSEFIVSLPRQGPGG